MFAVEIKTSVPWFLNNKMTPPNQWVKVAESISQKEAEKEVSWVQQSELDYKSVVPELKIQCRIVTNKQLVWSK